MRRRLAMLSAMLLLVGRGQAAQQPAAAFDMFLATLRDELGDDAFWSGIRAYSRAHAGGVVDSADFQQAMQHATPKDLSRLFTEWVSGALVP